jgi:hypothetical protein
MNNFIGFTGFAGFACFSGLADIAGLADFICNYFAQLTLQTIQLQPFNCLFSSAI